MDGRLQIGAVSFARERAELARLAGERLVGIARDRQLDDVGAGFLPPRELAASEPRCESRERDEGGVAITHGELRRHVCARAGTGGERGLRRRSSRGRRGGGWCGGGRPPSPGAPPPWPRFPWVPPAPPASPGA